MVDGAKVLVADGALEAEAEARVGKHGGGRPARVGKPWVGICSRSEWYRRKRGKP